RFDPTDRLPGLVQPAGQALRLGDPDVQVDPYPTGHRGESTLAIQPLEPGPRLEHRLDRPPDLRPPVAGIDEEPDAITSIHHVVTGAVDAGDPPLAIRDGQADQLGGLGEAAHPAREAAERDVEIVALYSVDEEVPELRSVEVLVLDLAGVAERTLRLPQEVFHDRSRAAEGRLRLAQVPLLELRLADLLEGPGEDVAVRLDRGVSRMQPLHDLDGPETRREGLAPPAAQDELIAEVR